MNATKNPWWLTAVIGSDESKKKRLNILVVDFIECKTIRKTIFRKNLDGLLKQGIPVIVSIQRDKHWAVTCGKKSKDVYFYIDSADSGLISYL